MSSVAACIIGNEVLNGKTLDTNSNYLAQKCFEYGLDLQQIRVISDTKSIIASNIRELSDSYDMVFSSGGIGPTHDDMTYESIGMAFERKLIYHEPTMDLMRNMMAVTELNDGQRRMAYMPNPDEVIFTPDLWVPLVRVKNVLVLPGVPRLFHNMLDHWLQTKLELSGLMRLKKIRRLVKTNCKESILAGPLQQIHDQVVLRGIDIGSYPKMLENGTTYVVLSVIGPIELSGQVEKIVLALREQFDGEEINA